MGQAESAVVFHDAAVQLGGRVVWSHINIEVERGDFVAILGPNGAGKSTLIKAVLGLLPLAEGSLAVLGQRPGQANRDMGYLPQRRGFDRGVRIRGVDVVRLGLDGNRWGIPLPGERRFSRRAAIAEERIAEVIQLVGAEPYAQRPIGELSGGEQQRLLIAQALARRPALLLLDEPLDSLDLPNQASVAALVQHICLQEGVTVLMVAHDVNPILPYISRVIYMARGAVVTGPPSTVISAATLSRLYDTPIEVLTTSDGRLVVVGQPEAPAFHADRHAQTHSPSRGG